MHAGGAELRDGQLERVTELGVDGGRGAAVHVGVHAHVVHGQLGQALGVVLQGAVLRGAAVVNVELDQLATVGLITQNELIFYDFIVLNSILQ